MYQGQSYWDAKEICLSLTPFSSHLVKMEGGVHTYTSPGGHGLGVEREQVWLPGARW